MLIILIWFLKLGLLHLKLWVRTDFHEVKSIIVIMAITLLKLYCLKIKVFNSLYKVSLKLQLKMMLRY